MCQVKTKASETWPLYESYLRLKARILCTICKILSHDFILSFQIDFLVQNKQCPTQQLSYN